MPGVRLFEMRQIEEPGRGCLTVGGFARDMPFTPRRFFLTCEVPEGKTRGNHAHRRCQQVLICVHGACWVRVDDGVESEEWYLDSPAFALLIPPLIWAVETLCSPDSILLVFASRDYEPEDYISNYDEFRAIAIAERQSRDLEARFPDKSPEAGERSTRESVNYCA